MGGASSPPLDHRHFCFGCQAFWTSPSLHSGRAHHWAEEEWRTVKILRPFQLPISGPVGAVPPKAHPRGLFYLWLPGPSLLWEEPFHSDLDQPCYPLYIPGLQPGFATCPIPGFSRVVLLGVAENAPSSLGPLAPRARAVLSRLDSGVDLAQCPCRSVCCLAVCGLLTPRTWLLAADC